MVRTGNAITFREGYVVLNQSETHGGVHLQREDISHAEIGDGEEREWKTKKIVDHTAMVRKVDKVAKDLDHAIRTLCSRFGKAWFVDDERKADLLKKIEEFEQRAIDINEESRLAGCARRVFVDVCLAPIDLSAPDAARSVNRTIVRVLCELRDLLKAGDVKGSSLDNCLRLRAARLPDLTTGIFKDAISFAVEEAKEARGRIKAKAKKGQTLESAGRQEDLPLLCEAIDLFGGPAWVDPNAPADAPESAASDDAPAEPESDDQAMGELADALADANDAIETAIAKVSEPEPAPANNVDVPFAAPAVDGNGWYLNCPKCLKRIDLTDEQVDDETPEPYAEHWHEAHN